STQLPANDGWTDADRWSNMLADTLNTTVYNYGKSGASAQYFADNTNNVMTNLIADNPKYCIIMLGLNKHPGGTAGERTAGQTIINTLKGADIIPVIMSTGMSVDYANGHYSFNRDSDIIERDTVWRNLADENELGYIDIWQRSLDEIADGRTRTIAGVTYEAWDWRIRNENACPNDDIFAPHAGHDIQAGVKTNVQDNYPNHIDLGSTWFTNIHLNRHGSFVVQNEIGQYFRTLVNFDSVTLKPTSGSVFETQTYEITGLSASTDYIYVVRSQNSEGTAYSSVRTFTTSSGGSVVNEDTISVSVTSSENDIGYTLSSNSVNTTSTVIYAGFNNSARYSVFNVDLSSANLTGATITAAVCSVWNYTSRADSFRVIVTLSDTVNAVIPTSRDIAEAQAKTTAYAVFEKQDETTWS